MRCHSEHELDSGYRGHRRESLGVVDTVALPETLGDEARLELADGTIPIGLDHPHQHARNGFVARWDIRPVDRLEHAFFEHLLHLNAIRSMPLVRIRPGRSLPIVLGDRDVAHLHANQLGSVRERSVPLSGLSSLAKDRRATQKGIVGGAVSHGERRKRKMIVISREDHSASLQKGVAIELATAPKGVLLEKQLQLHPGASGDLAKSHVFREAPHSAVLAGVGVHHTSGAHVNTSRLGLGVRR